MSTLNQVIHRVTRVCERTKHPNPRKLAKWLLEGFTRSRGAPIWLINTTAPIDVREMSCSSQLEQAIKTGLVASVGIGKEQYQLVPTYQLQKYLNQFAFTVKAMTLRHEAELKEHKEILLQLQYSQLDLDRQMRNLAKNIIEKLDPPFTEEKYEQYTQELPK